MQKEFEKIKERLGKESYQEFCDSPKIVELNDAIEIVNQVAEEYKHVTTCYLQSPCEYQNEDIQIDVNDGWIPCSERLPENDDEVLCWYECMALNRTHAGEMIQMCDVGWYSKRFNHWCGEPTVKKDSKVLAWQPLPQPYVKEK